MDNKPKDTQNNKTEDSKFKSRNVKHSPKDESSRATYSAKNKRDL